jgi:hypothetical protein
MRRLAWIIIPVFLTLSCVSQSGTADSSISAIELATLRCNLYGEWQEQEPPGGEAVAGIAWRWFFFDDGSGVRVAANGTDAGPSRAFIWFLEGRDLRISFGGTEGTVYRRIERWESDQMGWYDYELNVTELLDRNSVGRRPGRCESLLSTSVPQSF